MAAPRSGTIMGMPPARASAATMQKVPPRSRGPTHRRWREAERAHPDRRCAAGPRRSRDDRKQLELGALRTVADQQQSDRLAPLRLLHRTQEQVPSLFGQKRPIPASKVAPACSPSADRTSSRSCGDRNDGEKKPASTPMRIVSLLATLPIFEPIRKMCIRAHHHVEHAAEAAKVAPEPAEHAVDVPVGKIPPSQRYAYAASGSECMISERVAAPCQRPTMVALHQGDEASTWSGLQASSTA